MTATIVRQRDGAARLYTPYRKDFLEAFKEGVPLHLRRWDAEDKSWILTGAGIHLALSIARAFYALIEDIPADPPEQPKTLAVASPHAALFLTPDAPPELVPIVFRALAKLYHPDRGGDTRAMQRINAAHEILRAKRGAV